MAKKIQPFSTGSEFGSWESHNCNNCWKWSGHREFVERHHCQIDKALGEAYLGDGKISASIARRMGHGVTYDCPEREQQPPRRRRKKPGLFEKTPLGRSLTNAVSEPRSDVVGK